MKKMSCIFLNMLMMLYLSSIDTKALNAH